MTLAHIRAPICLGADNASLIIISFLCPKLPYRMLLCRAALTRYESKIYVTDPKYAPT